jgi:hypothetical protein
MATEPKVFISLPVVGRGSIFKQAKPHVLEQLFLNLPPSKLWFSLSSFEKGECPHHLTCGLPSIPGVAYPLYPHLPGKV